MITTTLTYAGRRVTTGGQLAYFYADEDGHLRGFKKALVTGAPIGARVELRSEEDGSYWSAGTNGPRVVGHAEDPRLIPWAAEDRAAVAEQSARAESKRIARAGVDPLKAQLEPVREALRGMSSDRRGATVGWILQYLLSGVTR